MKNHSNLIPAHTKRQSMVVYLIRRWMIACAVILIVTSVVCMAWRSDSLLIQQQLHGLNELGHDAESQLVTASALHQRRSELRRELSRLSSLSNTRVPHAVFGMFCDSASELSERMRLEEFSIRETTIIDAKNRSLQGFQVQVSASATDDAAIQVFVDGLRQSDLFNSVELRSTQGVTNSNGESRQFQVHCQLVVDVAERYEESSVAMAPPTESVTFPVSDREKQASVIHSRAGERLP